MKLYSVLIENFATIAAHTVHSQQKHFHQNFDPTLVYSPMSLPPSHYVIGKHPCWKKYPDCPDQFIDPILGRSIGFWDTSNNLAFFYDLGYCMINPKDEHDCKFLFNPTEEAYTADEEGEKLSKVLF